MKTARIEIDEKNKTREYRRWLRQQFDDVLDKVLGFDFSFTREEIERATQLFASLRMSKGEKGSMFMPEDEIFKHLADKFGKKEMNDHWDKISEKGYDIAEELFYECKAAAAAKRKQEEEEEERRKAEQAAERAKREKKESDLLASNAMAAEFKAAAGDRLKHYVFQVREADPFKEVRGFANICSGPFRNGRTESCLHEAIKFKQVIRTSDAGLKGFEFRKGEILDGTEFIGVDKAAEIMRELEAEGAE